MWSDWKNINEGCGEEKGGVYKVRLIDNGRQPFKINRFLDADLSGIIAIGSTENFKNRINAFQMVLLGKKYKHSEAKKLLYNNQYSKFNEVIKDYVIQYSFKIIMDKLQLKDEESELIKCYFIQFGEVPPLNSNLPDEKDWVELNCK